jgi:hypothetical protein
MNEGQYPQWSSLTNSTGWNARRSLQQARKAFVITIPTNYASSRYYSFLFVLSMQTKPKSKREYDTLKGKKNWRKLKTVTRGLYFV